MWPCHAANISGVSPPSLPQGLFDMSEHEACSPNIVINKHIDKSVDFTGTPSSIVRLSSRWYFYGLCNQNSKKVERTLLVDMDKWVTAARQPQRWMQGPFTPFNPMDQKKGTGNHHPKGGGRMKPSTEYYLILFTWFEPPCLLPSSLVLLLYESPLMLDNIQ